MAHHRIRMTVLVLNMVLFSRSLRRNLRKVESHDDEKLAHAMRTRRQCFKQNTQAAPLVWKCPLESGCAALHGIGRHEHSALTRDAVNVRCFSEPDAAVVGTRLHPTDVITHDEEVVGPTPF